MSMVSRSVQHHKWKFCWTRIGVPSRNSLFEVWKQEYSSLFTRKDFSTACDRCKMLHHTYQRLDHYFISQIFRQIRTKPPANNAQKHSFGVLNHIHQNSVTETLRTLIQNKIFFPPPWLWRNQDTTQNTTTETEPNSRKLIVSDTGNSVTTLNPTRLSDFVEFNNLSKTLNEIILENIFFFCQK